MQLSLNFGHKKADEAQEQFEAVFQNKDLSQAQKVKLPAEFKKRYGLLIYFVHSKLFLVPLRQNV